MPFAVLSPNALIEAWIPLAVQAWLAVSGGLMFGAVLGWTTHHVLLRRGDRADVKFMASVVGVLGGGAVTALFDPPSVLFGTYCVGLAGGFFAHAAVPRPARRRAAR